MLCPCWGNQGPAERWEDLKEVSVFQEVCFAGEEAPGAGSKGKWKGCCLVSAITLTVRRFPRLLLNTLVCGWLSEAPWNPLQHILLWGHSLDLGPEDIWREAVILDVITPERHLIFPLLPPQKWLHRAAWKSTSSFKEKIYPFPK